jgi:hypothetical protein
VDPDAGLRALRSVLKPDGAMHLMVYAPYGRAGIYMLQKFCRRIGIQANDEAIRDLIAALTALPPGHPLENLLRESPDFRQEAALADALLNPQDRSYSVPQLFDCIEKAGLTFGRWLKQAPYSPHCGVLARIPQASRLKSFPQRSSMPPSNFFATLWFVTAWFFTETIALTRNESLSPVTPGFAMCPFECQIPSVFRSGCPPGRGVC